MVRERWQFGDLGEVEPWRVRGRRGVRGRCESVCGGDRPDGGVQGAVLGELFAAGAGGSCNEIRAGHTLGCSISGLVGENRGVGIVTVLFQRERHQESFCSSRICRISTAIAGSQFKSPASKVIAIRWKSRHGLRIKYRELKYWAKVAGNDRRAVRESRANWRESARAAEAELQELKNSEASVSPTSLARSIPRPSA